ncbi:zinc/iron regulated transporter-related protein 88E [Anticarsia gemmatalis]|uniref:zinc/iron regulated transporter-related protein 88E n=1 Tax=Anticarsia gemmatalis TaxID=129554 RepID=UPI003F76DAC4
MQVIVARAISMLALGIGSFIAGMLPTCFSERTRQSHPLIISCLLCFGGGVLLSTSLVHMLPETREKLPEYSELMLCIGFFTVYLVDELSHLFVKRNNHSHEVPGVGERSSLLAREREDGEMRERHDGGSELCHVSHTEPCNRSASGVIGLLSALFVHSVLEGLAIGLQENVTQILLLFAAVASHKFVVGFCLGAELCENFPSRMCTHVICVTLFSMGSVVGIGVGAGLETVSQLKDSAAVPVMQGLAAGTLLYVTVSEVLPRERARWHERRRDAGLMQFISVGLGFVLMYLTTKYLDHDAD